MHKEYIAILGGSFNPPHIGHMRIAITVLEKLNLNHLFLMPCASPPHKPQSNLLPFALRKELLVSAVKTLPKIEICSIEDTLPIPSYTVDTLKELNKQYPQNRFVFILGSEDFTQFHTWSRWQEIPVLADLVILPRGKAGLQDFIRTVHTLWPQAKPCHESIPNEPSFALDQGQKIMYIEQLRLEISSSIIRELFLKNKSIDFLVPPTTQEILALHVELAHCLWNKVE